VCALSSGWGGVDEVPGAERTQEAWDIGRLGCMGFLVWRCVQVGTVQWVMVAKRRRVVVLRWNRRDSVQPIEDECRKGVLGACTKYTPQVVIRC